MGKALEAVSEKMVRHHFKIESSSSFLPSLNYSNLEVPTLTGFYYAESTVNWDIGSVCWNKQAPHPQNFIQISVIIYT